MAAQRTFRQKDMIWIDFDPQRGYEIKKRRPALVVSTNQYNNAAHFLVVVPITTTIRKLPSFYTLHGYKTHGQVNTQQIYSLDATELGNRTPEFIEVMRNRDFYSVAQLVAFTMGFSIG